MRFTTPLLTVLILLAPQAFAVKNLYSLCERTLMVEPEIVVPLAANQIALRGKLSYYWVQGMEDQIGWLIGDDFLKKNISPAPTHYMRWLSAGDQVFILDENGTVKMSGYYGETREKKEIQNGEESFMIHPNNPYLYRDRELTERLTGPDELREMFMKQNRAVVIQTLAEGQAQALQELLKPWWDRYEQNGKLTNRFVRVGRRRAYELAHFEEPSQGKISVETASEESQIYAVETGELLPGPTLRTHKYSLATDAGISKLQEGDRVLLLDAEGLVTFEGVIGSDELPSASSDTARMDGLVQKIRASQKAFAIKLKLRKLD